MIPLTTVREYDYFKGTKWLPQLGDSKRRDEAPGFLGLDTETYAEDASLLCLSDSQGRTLDGPTDFDKIFRFLTAHGRHTYFCWNLGYDAMIILKHLPFDTLKELRDEGFQGTAGITKVKYLIKKCLVLRRPKKVVHLYDAAQFYNRLSLAEASKTYLGDQKVYDGKYQNKRFPKEIEPEEKEKVVRYCQKDADLCYRLVWLWVQAFHKNFGFYPSRFYSTGYIMHELLKQKQIPFPYYDLIPEEVQKFAYRCYFGGRFEIFKRGKFQNVYVYDINSAYPYAISQMPDWSSGAGKWQRWSFGASTTPTYAFYRIKGDLKPDLTIAPFMFRKPNGAVICPSGRFETYCTLSEANAASGKDYLDFGEWLVTDGWLFEGPRHRRLADLMEEMYEVRQSLTHGDQRLIYRILMNSLYGKTAQIKPRTGILFSPVICAYITGFCRAMLYAGVRGFEDRVIGFATDSIISEEPLPLKIGTKMGEWKEEKVKDFAVYMNGVYFKEGKPHTRGFSPKTILPSGEVGLLLYDTLKAYIDGGTVKFDVQFLKPNTLLESLRRGLEIAKMEIRGKEIDLNGDHKRLWYSPLMGLEDKSQSRSVTIG